MPSWAVLPSNASEKTTTIIQSDFNTYSPDAAKSLAQHDAVIWALGVASSGINEEDYSRITYEYPMSLIKALKDAGVNEGRDEKNPFRFVYVSGEMADPTQTSMQMWARVKVCLRDASEFCNTNPGMKAHILRPAYFFANKDYPQDALNQRSSSGRIIDKIMGPVYRTVLPGFVTPHAEMAKVALEITKGRWPQQELFRNKVIRQYAKECGVGPNDKC